VRCDAEARITPMDREFLNFLACVEALMAISSVVGPLEARLLDDRQDARIALTHLFRVVAHSIALGVILVPAFDHCQFTFTRQRQSVQSA